MLFAFPATWTDLFDNLTGNHCLGVPRAHKDCNLFTEFFRLSFAFNDHVALENQSARWLFVVLIAHKLYCGEYCITHGAAERRIFAEFALFCPSPHYRHFGVARRLRDEPPVKVCTPDVPHVTGFVNGVVRSAIVITGYNIWAGYVRDKLAC